MRAKIAEPTAEIVAQTYVADSLMLLPKTSPERIAIMKTSIDIAELLLREARKVASRESTTLNSLVEEGLRRVLAERRRKTPFQLRLVTTGGRGLRPELRDASWSQIRDQSYQQEED